MNSKPEVKDLPCILVSLPKNDQLEPCMTKREAKWAICVSAAVKGLMKAAKYFPELSSLLDTLDEIPSVEVIYNGRRIEQIPYLR